MVSYGDGSGDGAWSKSIEVEESGYYWKEKAKVIQKCTLAFGGAPVVVELFCGCGGTSLGFEMAGFEVALGIDIHDVVRRKIAVNESRF
jgi:DNA (cytosine-5)-methyltransferase 1